MALKNLFSSITAVYDKLLGLVVLLALLTSLGYLGWNVGRVRAMQARFLGEINAMRPAHAQAAAADASAFERAIAQVRAPAQVAAAGWTNAMLVPEARVWCVDCRRPIPYAAEKCPFCKAVQPVDEENNPKRDFDKDGIPDELEVKYGLDPRNPADADQDLDNDGFTNREELNANPPTDPRNPNDYPSIVAKLCLVKLVADPFHLRFKSVIRMPDGERFAINTRGEKQTYFRKLGEQVEGFLLDSYEPKFRVEKRFGASNRVDISVLTLKRGDKLIPLTVGGRDVQYEDYAARLLLALDNSTHDLRIGGAIEIKGKKYQLIAIDTRRERVVLRDEQDGGKVEVLKCGEAGRGNVGGSDRQGETSQ